MGIKSKALPEDVSKTSSGVFNRIFAQLDEKYPSSKPILSAMNMIAQDATTVMDTVAPYIEKCQPYIQSFKEQAVKRNLDEYVPIVIGLMLCFFGGYLTMLPTALEAVRLLCWDDLKESYATLQRHYKVAVEENWKDDALDEDGNGIADVLEINKSELFSRKVALFVRTVDLNEVKSAARTIAAAIMSVIASLKVRFARVLTLGTSIAQMAQQYIPLEKHLSDNLPPELRKWANMIAITFFQTVSVAAAMVLCSVINTLHCSLCGAHLFVTRSIRLARDKGLLEEDITIDSPKARVLVGVVASVGFFWQMAHHDGLPFPMNLILLPLRMVEGTLNVLSNTVLI